MILFLLQVFLFGLVQCQIDWAATPCNHTDTSCMMQAQYRMYQKFVPAHNLDPLYLKTYTITTPEIQFTNYNPTMINLSGCMISTVVLDTRSGKLKHSLACPWVLIMGTYQSNGSILDVQPIDGYGPFFAIYYDLAIKYELDIAIDKRSNEKEYLSVKNITRLEFEPRGAMVLNYENMVAGNNTASQAAHQWLEVNKMDTFSVYQVQVLKQYFTLYLNRLKDYYSSSPLAEIYSKYQRKPKSTWLGL